MKASGRSGWGCGESSGMGEWQRAVDSDFCGSVTLLRFFHMWDEEQGNYDDQSVHRKRLTTVVSEGTNKLENEQFGLKGEVAESGAIHKEFI